MPNSIKPTHFADFQGLAALKQDAKTQQPDALKEAAKQFESLFTRMMLKNMRAANLGESMFDSQQTQFYQDMFDDQLAVHLSQGKGMGLADMLVKQLRQGAAPGDRSQVTGDSQKTSLQAIVTTAKDGAIHPTASASSVASKPDQQLAGPTQPRRTGSTEASLPRNFDAVLRSERQVGSSAQPDEFGLTALFQDGSARTERVAASESSVGAQPSARSDLKPQASGLRSSRTAIADSPQEFIQRMLPHAQKAARELGVDPHALVAQAALETGWGKSVPCASDGTCSYNLFGIKANSNWNGGSVGARTLEFESGIPVATRARFRSYGSPEESFRDYAALIGNSERYTQARNTGNNVHAFASALQAGGYATDPQYARKLSAVTQTVRNLAGEAIGFKLAQQPPIHGSEGVRG